MMVKNELRLCVEVANTISSAAVDTVHYSDANDPAQCALCYKDLFALLLATHYSYMCSTFD